MKTHDHCHAVWYCSRDHQVRDFPRHKLECKYLSSVENQWSYTTRPPTSYSALRTIPNGPKKLVARWNLVEWWHGNLDFCVPCYTRATFFAWHVLHGCFWWHQVCHGISLRWLWTNWLHCDHCIPLYGLHMMADGTPAIIPAVSWSTTCCIWQF
jgi:hypothetical protein